jgi:Tol biopolymer transport system component
MATVYLAHDLKHDRPVALKVLRAELAASLGPDRFRREIHLAARLQHPHILSVHDSGEAAGQLWFTMPYVEGESLRTRLTREGQLPIEAALRITREAAQALQYAHDHGVIHRDIKPENLLLTTDGATLVADFGIARALGEPGSGEERLTATGLSLGTPRYMSPEQASADRAVDARTDVYSLGCVLYEMLAGHPPFLGTTAQEILARHALDPVPPLRAARGTVPEAVERSIMRALTKLPADRFRTAAEFATALTSPSAVRAHGLWGRRAVRVAARAVVALALATSGLVIARVMIKSDQPRATARQLTFSGNALMAALSPDGQFLAYVAPSEDSQRVVVQDMAGGTPDTIAAMSGEYPGVVNVEWSPEGTRLLLGTEGRALILPRLGGTLRSIGGGGQFPGEVYAYWARDSRVSLHGTRDHRVLLMNAAEQDDTLSIPVGGKYTWLLEGAWSPDGGVFAVTTWTADPVRFAVSTVTLDGRTNEVVADSVPVSSPRWSRDGAALYYVRGREEVWRLRLMQGTGRRRGSPELVQRQLQMLSARFGLLQFSLTPDGRRMVYVRGSHFSNLWMVEPSGPQASPSALTTGTALRWSPVVSPDGQWIAFVQQAAGAADLFRIPIDGGVASQLTDGARVWRNSRIAWSPDGRQLAFESVRGPRAQVWVANVEDGRTRELDQTRMSFATGHLAWAPGSRIAYQRSDHHNISLVDPSTEVEQFLATDTTGYFYSPVYSADGNRLAVWWLRSPEDRGIWLFDLRDASSYKIGMGPWPLGWSPDGRYLYAQPPLVPTLFQVDVRGTRAPEQYLPPPFRTAECTHAGARRPNAFVCAAFDFVSDVWMIENFDSDAP